jgi:hypothetical protein
MTFTMTSYRTARLAEIELVACHRQMNQNSKHPQLTKDRCKALELFQGLNIVRVNFDTVMIQVDEL